MYIGSLALTPFEYAKPASTISTSVWGTMTPPTCNRLQPLLLPSNERAVLKALEVGSLPRRGRNGRICPPKSLIPILLHQNRSPFLPPRRPRRVMPEMSIPGLQIAPKAVSYFFGRLVNSKYFGIIQCQYDYLRLWLLRSICTDIE